MTSLATTIGWIAPDKVAGLKPAISHISAFLWDPIAVVLLKLPTWVVLGVLGALSCWRRGDGSRKSAFRAADPRLAA